MSAFYLSKTLVAGDHPNLEHLLAEFQAHLPDGWTAGVALLTTGSLYWTALPTSDSRLGYVAGDTPSAVIAAANDRARGN